MRGRALSCAVAAAALLACGGTGGSGTGGKGGGDSAHLLPVASLAIRTVSWNPAMADPGHVTALAELGGELVLFGDHGATVLTAGLVTASDASVTAWKGAAAIPAADGNGSWLTGVDATGTLFRLRAGTTLDPVSDAYGISKVKLDAVAAMGGTDTAFAFATGLAVSDGAKSTLYDHAFPLLAGAGGRAAGADANSVFIFDTASDKVTSYALPGVVALAFDSAGVLHVETPSGLYGETKTTLSLVYRSDAKALHGLAASGARLWFLDGGEMGLIEMGGVSRTSGAALPTTASLVGSPSGDVWMLDQGALTRHTADQGAHDDERAWEETVQPVFVKSCTPCHVPGGPSGIDLSTYAAWVARRKVVRTRVIDKKNMPPAGTVFTDADRAAIDAWTAASGM